MLEAGKKAPDFELPDQDCKFRPTGVSLSLETV